MLRHPAFSLGPENGVERDEGHGDDDGGGCGGDLIAELVARFPQHGQLGLHDGAAGAVDDEVGRVRIGAEEALAGNRQLQQAPGALKHVAGILEDGDGSASGIRRRGARQLTLLQARVQTPVHVRDTDSGTGGHPGGHGLEILEAE